MFIYPTKPKPQPQYLRCYKPSSLNDCKWIHSEMRMWHDKNIQSTIFLIMPQKQTCHCGTYSMVFTASKVNKDLSYCEFSAFKKTIFQKFFSKYQNNNWNDSALFCKIPIHCCYQNYSFCILLSILNISYLLCILYLFICHYLSIHLFPIFFCLITIYFTFSLIDCSICFIYINVTIFIIFYSLSLLFLLVIASIFLYIVFVNS